MTRVFFIVLLASALCCSCRTVRVIEQVPVEVKGDTIFVTNEVTKTKFVTKTDTAYRYIERPVTISKTETVEVKKPLAWWQKALMWSGVAALVVLLAVLLAKFWQLFRR